MMNISILQGNLTRDPELKYTQDGLAIANCSIAVNKRQTNKEDKTTFVDLTFFGKQAETVNQYLSKGSKILVNGELNQDTWNDKTTGQLRSRHYMIVDQMTMLDSKEYKQIKEAINNISDCLKNYEQSKDLNEIEKIKSIVSAYKTLEQLVKDEGADISQKNIERVEKDVEKTTKEKPKQVEEKMPEVDWNEDNMPF